MVVHCLVSSLNHKSSLLPRPPTPSFKKLSLMHLRDLALDRAHFRKQSDAVSGKWFLQKGMRIGVNTEKKDWGRERKKGTRNSRRMEGK